MTLSYLVGADAAIVGALGSGEPVLGPAEGVAILVEEGVLLLDAEPGRLRLGALHDFVASLAAIGLGRDLVVLIGLAEDELVVAQPERITVDRDGVEIHVRVRALGLAR